MRGQLVSQVNTQCRELLVPELLKLDRDDLNAMMGWQPSAQDKFGKWANLDPEVPHRTAIFDDGDSDRTASTLSRRSSKASTFSGYVSLTTLFEKYSLEPGCSFARLGAVWSESLSSGRRRARVSSLRKQSPRPTRQFSSSRRQHLASSPRVRVMCAGAIDSSQPSSLIALTVTFHTLDRHGFPRGWRIPDPIQGSS
jgi:hypothetical protein